MRDLDAYLRLHVINYMAMYENAVIFKFVWIWVLYVLYKW